MPAIEIVDITDEASFAMVPPCADPGFDHRSCDYWEAADRGSKAARSSWLERPATPAPPPKPTTGNPFLDDLAEPDFNPFAASGGDAPANNPFAPTRPTRSGVSSEAPPKLGLLVRGFQVFGSYAKVLTVDQLAVAYAQFGPLSAYPRASRLRDLYPQLPDSPLPAVITCIATTREARRQGYAKRLIAAVCGDLAGRGFAAVEAYPERGTREDATSSATPEFWVDVGFVMAVADDRFPVMRREL
jgi:ribosomal protein S18 acetylase RimI-like enzyme